MGFEHQVKISRYNSQVDVGHINPERGNQVIWNKCGGAEYAVFNRKQVLVSRYNDYILAWSGNAMFPM